MTVIGSLWMILMEVPIMLVLAIVLYSQVFSIDQKYREENEKLTMKDKEQEIELMKVVNQIDQGKLYLQVFKCEERFKHTFK